MICFGKIEVEFGFSFLCTFKISKMTSLESRAIQRYQRENEEQLETIRKICAALNQPQLAEMIANRQYEFTASHRIRFLNATPGVDNSRNEELLRKIAELEEELERKKNNYNTLEKQIADYLHNAKEFEDLLEKNEREKAELLKLFQQTSNSNINASLTLEELEDKVSVMKQERDKLKAEAQDAKVKCEKLKEQLQTSHNYAKELQQQLFVVKARLSTDSPMIKYRNNEETIENLEKQLERAKQKIKSLADDNEMLKKAMIDSTDDDLNVSD
ncbi:hypothetical protein TRFO_24301 [Tritrichomonas foetus]|uniref:Uncharacterized protein n=1 Tax=Tritrichomonas foetus TaxID=1144522 RepID=A0A1J4KDE1_9EUKA|nr:hypothetical protein TRFO_24301 [Tritrichomonas foetus]|eukprot:OHT07477.1 hypothetical protein TRFO_24301 [Tritrichomonas foetus]